MTTKDTTIDQGTKIPLFVAVSIMAVVASGVAGYSGTLKAIEDKPGETRVREITREEIKAANIANGTDVAVLVQRVKAVEEQVRVLTEEQRESNKLLRQLVKP